MDVEPFICSSSEGTYVRFCPASSVLSSTTGDCKRGRGSRQKGQERKNQTKEKTYFSSLSKLPGSAFVYDLCPDFYELMSLIPSGILLELHRDPLLLIALETLFVFSSLADSRGRRRWLCGSSNSDSGVAEAEGEVEGELRRFRACLLKLSGGGQALQRAVCGGEGRRIQGGALGPQEGHAGPTAEKLLAEVGPVRLADTYQHESGLHVQSLEMLALSYFLESVSRRRV